MTIKLVDTPFPKYNLDLLEIFLIDMIRPVVEGDHNYKDIKDLRVLNISDSTRTNPVVFDRDYINVNWTGTVVRLDDWVRTYNTYPAGTVMIKISDIVNRYREYRLNTLLDKDYE